MHHRGNTLKSRALATYASVPLLSEGGGGDTSYDVRQGGGDTTYDVR